MRKVYLKSLRGTQLLIALFVTAVLLFTIVLTGCSIDDENETSADFLWLYAADYTDGTAWLSES